MLRCILFPASDAIEPERQAPLRDLRVLVVDDDDDARELMTMTLQSVGAIVSAADSVRAALEVLSHQHIEVLVSDIAMPFEDGYDLIRRLRHGNPLTSARTAPALAVTAFASRSDRAKALDAGFQEHLPKPFDSSVLVDVISRLVVADSKREQ